MTLKELLRNKILSGSEEEFSILEYKANYSKMYTTLRDLLDGELKLYSMAHGAVMDQGITYKNDYVDKMHFMYSNNKDISEKVYKLQQTIFKLLASVDPKMTQLEKALYIHDWLMENTYYKNDGNMGYYPVTLLLNGYGVCDAYTTAYNYILELLGIEVSYVCSSNHKWTAIKIDGKWYHIDTTWDDNSNKVSFNHEFFVIGDSKLKSGKGLSRKHEPTYYATGDAVNNKPFGNNTEFDDWYVHKVKNKMYYDGGYWYYIENNCVVKNDIKGTCRQVLIDASKLKKPVKIVSVVNGELTVSVENTKVCTKTDTQQIAKLL